jgi:hypothetical protein
LRIRCVADTSSRVVCANSAVTVRAPVARAMLNAAAMRTEESWSIPLQIVVWAVIVVGVIMAMAVVLMH